MLQSNRSLEALCRLRACLKKGDSKPSLSRFLDLPWPLATGKPNKAISGPATSLPTMCFFAGKPVVPRIVCRTCWAPTSKESCNATGIAPIEPLPTEPTASNSQATGARPKKVPRSAGTNARTGRVGYALDPASLPDQIRSP